MTIPQDIGIKEKAILIQDSVRDFNDLSERATDLIEKVNNGKRFEEIHYDKLRNNFFIICIIVVTVVIALAIFGFILYRRFYNINTWTKLSTKFDGYDLPFEKMFVRKLYPTTPRRNSLALEMDENYKY